MQNKIFCYFLELMSYDNSMLNVHSYKLEGFICFTIIFIKIFGAPCSVILSTKIFICFEEEPNTSPTNN